jgi:hypothetical protein
MTGFRFRLSSQFTEMVSRAKEIGFVEQAHMKPFTGA